jgi:hypothetical protein
MKNLAAGVLNNVHSHRQPDKEFTVLLNQIYKKISKYVDQCCGRDVYPRSRIRIFTIPDPVSASKNISILTQEIVS